MNPGGDVKFSAQVSGDFSKEELADEVI